MEYICKICNKNYKSYQSLWNHNHKFHVNRKSADIQQPISILSAENQQPLCNKLSNKLSCKHCKKAFKHIQSRWRHEIKCSEEKQKENIELENKIKSIVKKEIKNNRKPTTNIKVNGSFINGNNTDSGPKMIIYKTGTENMDLITYNEVSTIFDNEISSVIKLIELVNFNENKPENHSFCSTNLESPYLSFYNTNTNTVNKQRKRHFFEDVICKSIQNHEILYSKYKNKFSYDKRKKIEDNISNLKAIKDNSFNSKIMGELISKLNLISYNNRELIQDTWNGKYGGNDSDEEFMKMLLDDPETQSVIKADKLKQLNNTSNLVSSDSDSESDSTSESDGEKPDILPKLNYNAAKSNTLRQRNYEKDLEV